MQWQSEAWQLWLLRADGSCTDWSNLRHTGRIYDFRRYFRWGFLYTLNICLIFMFSVLLYYYGWGVKVFTTHSLHITGAKKGEREYVNWISDHFFRTTPMHPPNFLFLHMHMCGWRDKINSHPDRMDHLSNLYSLWLSDSFDLCSIGIFRGILVIMSFVLLGTSNVLNLGLKE